MCTYYVTRLSLAASLRHSRHMAPPRIENVGSIYHVNGNAVDGTRLFVDEVDRLSFLSLLEREAALSDWCVLAYTLMTTHYHMLFRLENTTLSSGFRRLNSMYARRYNLRHDRRGALWQRRFHDSIIEVEGHLFETIRYIALNPPRANMCRKPEDWAWSSYGSAVGLHPPDPLVDEHELLGLFGTRRQASREWLRRYVEEADLRERRRQTMVRRPEARPRRRARGRSS
jgi:REP-associated tyrosine transposase